MKSHGWIALAVGIALWGAGCGDDDDKSGGDSAEDTALAVEDCANDADDDGDGLTDCEDVDDCADACVEDCLDELDNDDDALIDCEDPDCSDECVENCIDDEDNNANGLVDCVDPACEKECDGDSDGYDNLTHGGEDCDDDNPDIFPGAPEVCNDLDDDCDDLIDDNDPGLQPATATEWHKDQDGDGYGGAPVAELACQPSDPTYTEDDTDCADLFPEINPGAPEVCNGFDDNCDDLVDIDDPALDTSTLITCYLDDDGDGFGDPDTMTSECECPSGYVENSDDCDDTDQYVGAITVWLLDDDGDGFGAGPPDGPPSCDETNPGHAPESAGLDCNDDDMTVFPGADEICGDGIDQDCDTFDLGCALDVADVILLGGTGTEVGSSVASAGDGDGDGVNEIIIGATLAASGRGAAFLVRGPPPAGVNDLPPNATATLNGEVAGDETGASVAGGVDFNNDALDDVLIGAPGADAGAGTVYMVQSNATGDITLGDSANATFFGINPGDQAGFSVAGTDITDDGVGEVFIGAPTEDFAGADAGAAYVVRGPVNGMMNLVDADVLFTGEAPGDNAGWSVSGGGDLNGDGTNDLLIGAPGAAGGNGAAYVAFAPVSGLIGLATVDARFAGLALNDAAGAVVASAGDVNFDGHDDFVVGANGRNALTGEGYLVLGNVTPGLYDLTSVEATLLGQAVDDQACKTLASAGDVDGDDFGDLIAGAAAHDSPPDSNVGAAYFLYGPVSGTIDLGAADLAWLGEGAAHFAGTSVAGVGDVSGDAVPDLLVGAVGEDTNGAGAGAAYLLFGGAF